jgi:catechol 2,3-dioxygenase-like lactoylglutathione lyase family enzyme
MFVYASKPSTVENQLNPEKEVAMSVRRLEHCNIRTSKFQETVAFYETFLGLKARRAPMAPEHAPATWLYDESGEAVIHLTPYDPSDPGGSYARIINFREGEPVPEFVGGGAIDHIAFDCHGYANVKALLQSNKVKFAENAFPSSNLQQLFIRDPNGVTLELNFRSA